LAAGCLAFLFGLAAFLLLFGGPAAMAQEIVTLSTRPGVMQSFFIANLPQNPQAIALLFPGASGVIRLREDKGQIKFGPNNFLVRSRGEFVKRGVITVIVDAPSDRQNGGMSDDFRLGTDHFADISAVVADIGKRFPGLPIFLVGTSRGTISAAALGARLGSQLAGVVLSSTLFRQFSGRSGESGPGLSRFDFGTVKVSVLFVHHVSDQCTLTPYGDAARLADKYPLISVFGGRAPESGPCDPFSAHGYFGKESETVEEIINWMLKKPFREEVR
jgi:pimeloyl-ACP methyl ester carboxylesterase